MQGQLILILGSTGQLGSELVRACQTRKSWKVQALSHREIEVADAQAIKNIIEKQNPWAVLNCTAYNQVDAAEENPAPAFTINCAAVASLARTCCDTNSLLVHFSSDYVFDGRAGRPYTEDDPPSPLNLYGLSKLSGEQALRLLQPRHCIVRTCGLYGQHRSSHAKLNFVEAILAKARDGQTLQVRADLVCTPTSASELADLVCLLLEREAVGTFHATNSGSCSWHEFGSKILEYEGIRRKIVQASSPAGKKTAPRPAYSVLSTAKLTSSGIRPMSSWQEALGAYLRQRTK